MAGLLEHDEAPAEVFTRLEQEEGGLALRLGHVHPGDNTFAHDGKTVLVLSDGLCQ